MTVLTDNDIFDIELRNIRNPNETLKKDTARLIDEVRGQGAALIQIRDLILGMDPDKSRKGLVADIATIKDILRHVV